MKVSCFGVLFLGFLFCSASSLMLPKPEIAGGQYLASGKWDLDSTVLFIFRQISVSLLPLCPCICLPFSQPVCSVIFFTVCLFCSRFFSVLSALGFYSILLLLSTLSTYLSICHLFGFWSVLRLRVTLISIHQYYNHVFSTNYTIYINTHTHAHTLIYI